MFFLEEDRGQKIGADIRESHRSCCCVRESPEQETCPRPVSMVAWNSEQWDMSLTGRE